VESTKLITSKLGTSKTLTSNLSQTDSDGNWLSAPFCKLNKKILFSFLQHIHFGRLTIIDNNSKSVFGDGKTKNGHALEAIIQVNDQRFYTHVLIHGSIGAGEAYFNNWWQSPDTTAVVELIAANIHMLDRLEKIYNKISFPFHKVGHLLNRNSKSQSKQNISAHYDLGNELYSRFLDPTMLYSAAMYEDENTSLHQASLNKLKAICAKLSLKSTDHLLEIGTGWGGLAIFAAQNYGCKVTTTTISEEQHAYVEQKIKQLGLESHITLLKKDYRDLDGHFDKLVSIEMIEAVGHEYLPGYFETCNNLLKPGGKFLLQSILIENERYDSYRRGVDFIQKYIFPGGLLPSPAEIFNHTQAQTDMTIVDVEYFGIDYAKTLEDWRHNFNQNWDDIKQHGYDEKFRRLWNFYFHYCEGGFLQGTIDVGHFVLKKSILKKPD